LGKRISFFCGRGAGGLCAAGEGGAGSLRVRAHLCSTTNTEGVLTAGREDAGEFSREPPAFFPAFSAFSALRWNCVRERARGTGPQGADRADGGGGSGTRGGSAVFPLCFCKFRRKMGQGGLYECWGKHTPR
jgi:hypothetical protein